MKLKERYAKEVVGHLTKEFDYKNVMQVPKVEKIVINMGLGEATANAKAIEGGVKDLVAITGQKPVINRARKSIARMRRWENRSLSAHALTCHATEWERPANSECTHNATFKVSVNPTNPIVAARMHVRK